MRWGERSDTSLWWMVVFGEAMDVPRRSPGLLARVMNRISAVQFSAGLLPPKRAVTLEVPGRRTGRVVSFPLVVVDQHGERYLVAMLGNGANWCATSAPPGGARCCGVADARTCTGGPGLTYRWTGAPRWRISSEPRRSSPFSACLRIRRTHPTPPAVAPAAAQVTSATGDHG